MNVPITSRFKKIEGREFCPHKREYCLAGSLLAVQGALDKI